MLFACLTHGLLCYVADEDCAPYSAWLCASLYFNRFCLLNVWIEFYIHLLIVCMSVWPCLFVNFYKQEFCFYLFASQSKSGIHECSWGLDEKSLISFFFFLRGTLLFIYFYFWLCWVFVSVRGLSPVAASGGHSSSRCAGLSLSRSTGSRRAGSVVVAHGPSCSVACGILPDQGSNLCLLH